MRWWRKKKTQKFIAGFFLSVLLLQGGVASVELVHAQASQSQVRAVDNAIDAQVKAQTTQTTATPAATAASSSGNGMFGWMLDAIMSAFIWLLLQLRNLIYYLIVSPAAGAFVWVINPDNVSGPTGVMNLPAVYTLWQFIRDFFNLFFILILLFSAFATIFQVDSFNIRNIFKNVLLVALLINFSFPITRFLIDAANVPMYYFINDVLGAGTGNGGQTAMNNLLADSGLAAGVLTNVGENSSITLVLTSIVFAFLFGISLAVLSVMMIIRLIVLTLLLVFSPIGFAGSLLPGLRTYGNDWWTNFWNYALFGPAAALLLTVSLKFLQAVTQGSTWKTMTDVTTNQTADPASAVGMAQVILFTFPIILIWITIGMANKFSIAGAATIVSAGKWLPNKIQQYGKRAVISTAKFTGRAAVGTTKAVASRVPVMRNVPGAAAGVKEAFKDGGKIFGKELPKWATVAGRKEAAENRVATGKGFIQGGRDGATAELRKLEDERVRKAVKESKEKGVAPEKHIETLKDGPDNKASAFEKRVAALSLAQEGEIRTATQLAQALDAVRGNADEFNHVLDRAKPEAIGSMGTAENSRITKLLNEKDETTGASKYGARQADLQQAYNAKLKKENKVEYRVQSELARRVSSGTGPVNPMKVYEDNLKMGARDLSKQSGLIQSAKASGSDPIARAYFEEMAKNEKDSFEKILASDDLKKEDRTVLIEIQNSVGAQSQQAAPRSQAYRNAQAAFNPSPNNANQNPNNAGQNSGPPQNP